MQTGTLVLIMVAAVVSLAIVLFQYYYKTKSRAKLHVLLSFLRFLTLFCTFLLLINPKFAKNSYALEKANLVILADNSSSIDPSMGKMGTAEILKQLEENGALQDQYSTDQYSFGTALKEMDTLSFKEKNTDITNALIGIDEIYAQSNTAILLLTDGNQTLGQDYGYYSGNEGFPVYPIVLGDTTRYEDICIDKVNLNKYAFLKNKYPVEIYVSYEGAGPVNTSVSIAVNGKRVFSETIAFSNSSNSKIINTVLSADTVGLKTLRVEARPLRNEKNVQNNRKDMAIEVIDEKTKIVIISDVLHPDIGALIKSIESNEQRSVTVRKPNSGLKDLDDTSLFILYQPNASFSSIYDYVKRKNANIFTITGSKTDWGFLNKVQSSFEKNNYNQTEEISPISNAAFSIFNVTDFSLENFPPLIGNLGEIIIGKSNEMLLGQRVKGVEINEPLLAVLKNDREREAVLFGEHLWKWRMQTYRNSQSFENFDDFMGKLILYLSTTKAKERLSMDYESVYVGANEAKITATYFDKTFVFDTNAAMTLKLSNIENGAARELPMLLKGGYYEADLSGLPAAKYN
ncbi:MAG: VWA domain-containing protein, partial [Bacteroidota bacterium]